MENNKPGTLLEGAVDLRQLAVALIDISSDVRRKSHEDAGVPLLPNGMVDIMRVIEAHPGITVAEVAARLNRQFSNVSTQLRELVARGLVTRIRDAADKRYVTLHPTPESQRIRTLLETMWADTLGAAAGKLRPEEKEQIAASLPALQRLAALIGEPD
ncbi:MarR family transcriptional regulator [Arthrobacter crystallopoietes]|jgi:DNA-binding MarR family transcriptional regulator|uniref:MarR family winged helix-turn-helix transcriptional regulator n=1 Tax=Micrococcaceae TaxID=1268 RepID=UPI0021C56AF4|nr:MarR family transcriptional regulator [Arthrobacter sp. Marseille-P9274]